MEKAPNFHELFNERKNLREVINDPEQSEYAKEVAGEALTENKEKTKAGGFSLEKLGGLSNAREMLKAEKEKSKRNQDDRWIDKEAISAQLGQSFDTLSALKEKMEDHRDFEMQRLRAAQSDPYARKTNEKIIARIQIDKKQTQEKIDTIETKDPRVSRAVELVGYKKGLHQEGHIAPTPSVRENLQKIGRRMIAGKPMFLHGPTGTGKTSLARFAASHFTGKDAEMVYCTPQTRESNIWGKTGIKPTENGAIETVDIFGPLARSMTEGKVVVFDEFTALPKEQMVFIKGIFNAKVGDKVNIVGNGKVEIAPGFQMIFTANLKSDKNPERQELPPEITREFEQNNLEVAYTPKEEAYDIMLARLTNPDGSLDMSWHDLNTILPKLCEAMEEIQIAYTDKEREETARLTGTMDAAGKRKGLKKFVMTQGTIEAILEDWAVEKQIESRPQSFTAFLDTRLQTGLTFKEYPEADRVLAAKILASKGFLRTLTPSDLGLPSTVFDFDAAKKQRGDTDSTRTLLKQSAQVKHLSITEVADLDPFGKRAHATVAIAESFLTPEGIGGDAFSKDMEQRLRKVLGRERGATETVISAEYLYKNPKSGTVERQETIELDIEKSLEKYVDLYKETGIPLPDDFHEQILDIWDRNRDEIEKAISEKGFNEMIIAPANIPLVEVQEKMKMANGNYTGSNFDAGGGFAGAVSSGVDTPRIILVHKVQNIKDTPEQKATLGVKAQDTKVDETLSLEDYFYFQRSYFKEMGKHLDEVGLTWLSRTKSNTRFVYGSWNPTFGELSVYAADADYSNPDLGCRPSRYFI